MAYTQSDLDAIRGAIISGTLRVRFESGGTVREVTYRSLADLQTAEAAIVSALAAQTGGRPKQFHFGASKGLESPWPPCR